MPRQVRSVTVTVEQLDDGRWRFTSPRIPGWGAAARHPGEVTAALRSAFTERQVAAYSDWRGAVSDLATPNYRRSHPASRGGRRRDVYDPTMWRMTENGQWISPRGLIFPEHTDAVQRVMGRRMDMGLPPRPDPARREVGDRMVVQTVTARKVVQGAPATPLRMGQLVIQKHRPERSAS